LVVLVGLALTPGEAWADDPPPPNPPPTQPSPAPDPPPQPGLVRAKPHRAAPAPAPSTKRVAPTHAAATAKPAAPAPPATTAPASTPAVSPAPVTEPSVRNLSRQDARRGAKRHARVGRLARRGQPAPAPFVVPASRHERAEIFLSAGRPVSQNRPAGKGDTDGRTPILVMALLASVLAVCGMLAWLLTFVHARGQPGQRRPEGANGAVSRERSRPARAPGGGGIWQEPERSVAADRPTEPALDPIGAAVREQCEIEWFRGYVKSQFLAVADRPNGALVRESPWFAWRATTPPPQQERIAAARDHLVQALLRDGWEWSGVGEQWYSVRLQRTVHVGVDA
jgi:hypothetical protein